MLKKNIMLIVLILFMVSIFVMCGNSSNDSSSSNSSSNKYVNTIYNGNFDDYPDVSVGKAFDSFFANPSWEYFKSEDGEHIVEFDGGAMLGDDNVLLEIQFEVDPSTNRFDIIWFGIDGESEDFSELYEWIDVVFENYYDTHNISNTNSNTSSNIDSECLLSALSICYGIVYTDIMMYGCDKSKEKYKSIMNLLEGVFESNGQELTCDSDDEIENLLNQFIKNPKQIIKLLDKDLEGYQKLTFNQLFSDDESIIQAKDAMKTVVDCYY